MKGRDALNSQYKKGVLELCVLSLLQTQDRYGYEISEFLSAHIDIAGSSMSTNGINEIREKNERFSDACHRQNAGQIQAESKRGKHVRKRRRFFMKTQLQKPDADAGRCKDEALQRAPRQIQEQFQHRMVPPVFNRKCRTGRAEGLLPEGQDVRSCRAQFPSRPGF